MTSRPTSEDLPTDPSGWDLDLVFDETYLDFYREALGPTRTIAEVERVLRLLAPPTGGRLVDLCCGHGRHAWELAKRGVEVVGVDRSAGFLRRAREGAPSGARFVRADVAALPLPEEGFDGAYCWFSSIGYRGPAEDLAMLREARRVLRPGARLAVETRNWATVETGESVIETSRGRMVDRVERDEAHERLRTRRRYESRGGAPREVAFSLHLYDAAGFARLLGTAGFADVRAFDGEDRPLFPTAKRVAFVGRRPPADP